MVARRKPLLNLNNQIQFELPLVGFILAYQTIDLPLVASPFYPLLFRAIWLYV